MFVTNVLFAAVGFLLSTLYMTPMSLECPPLLHSAGLCRRTQIDDTVLNETKELLLRTRESIHPVLAVCNTAKQSLHAMKGQVSALEAEGYLRQQNTLLHRFGVIGASATVTSHMHEAMSKIDRGSAILVEFTKLVRVALVDVAQTALAADDALALLESRVSCYQILRWRVACAMSDEQQSELMRLIVTHKNRLQDAIDEFPAYNDGTDGGISGVKRVFETAALASNVVLEALNKGAVHMQGAWKPNERQAVIMLGLQEALQEQITTLGVSSRVLDELYGREHYRFYLQKMVQLSDLDLQRYSPNEYIDMVPVFRKVYQTIAEQAYAQYCNIKVHIDGPDIANKDGNCRRVS